MHSIIKANIYFGLCCFFLKTLLIATTENFQYHKTSECQRFYPCVIVKQSISIQVTILTICIYSIIPCYNCYMSLYNQLRYTKYKKNVVNNHISFVVMKFTKRLSHVTITMDDFYIVKYISHNMYVHNNIHYTVINSFKWFFKSTYTLLSNYYKKWKKVYHFP